MTFQIKRNKSKYPPQQILNSLTLQKPIKSEIKLGDRSVTQKELFETVK